MRRLAAAPICVFLGLLARQASGDTPAGPQPVPPVQRVEPALDQQLDARRNVRGCAVGDDCTAPGDVLREFEAERIPPPGSPWVSEKTPPGSHLEAGKPRIVKKPSELRPDAP